MKHQLTFLFLLLFCGTITAQISFEKQTIASPNNNPRSTQAGDLDGDGDMDVISANFESGTISWYENIDGQGLFSAPQLISVEDDYTFVHLGDIDNDGDLDIAINSWYLARIKWFENTNGQGDFELKQTLGANLPNSTHLVDMDGDNDLDVLTTYHASNYIYWYENTDGQGTFDTDAIPVISIYQPRLVHAEDLDGDGNKDIITSSAIGSISWSKNLGGAQTFDTLKLIAYAGIVRSIASHDLDNDGDMDIVTADENGPLMWYQNDGQGNFTSQYISSSIGTKSIALSDIDLDGDMDIVTACPGTSCWHENMDGLGTFSPTQAIGQTTTAGITWSIYSADIDGDGDQDILHANESDDEVKWYRNGLIERNKVLGKITYDENADNCATSTTSVANAAVMIQNQNSSFNLTTFSLADGFYEFQVDEGTFITSMSASTPGYLDVSPPSDISTFAGLSQKDTINFCLSPNQDVNDLNISLYPLENASPGFYTNYELVYSNVGTTELDGNIILTYNDSQLDFQYASSFALQSANTLEFSYSNLKPFESRKIKIRFKAFTPPTVNIGDVLNFSMTIYPLVDDYTPFDNTFSFSQIVIGSFDPNDITVLEGDQILLQDADKYLHYLIRFQNTGTAPAIHVRVENILDDHLDWSSFQLESTSHETLVEIKDGNQLCFKFYNIILPDSTANEPASHGYIAYKIKPKDNVDIGNIIYNKADIYFDFNLPVETNIVSTEIVSPLSIKNINDFIFSIYPTPTSSILTINSKTKIEQIIIYDQLGQLLLFNKNQNTIDLSSLSSGIYFCKVSTKNGALGVKKVLKK